MRLIIINSLIGKGDAHSEDKDNHQPRTVLHIRVGLHSSHAEGKHRAQGRYANRSVQAHLHGTADGRGQEAYGLQNIGWQLHHHGSQS